MLNKAGFDRDVALLAEYSTASMRTKEEIDTDVYQLADDYEIHSSEVWYALAHALIERSKT